MKQAVLLAVLLAIPLFAQERTEGDFSARKMITTRAFCGQLSSLLPIGGQCQPRVDIMIVRRNSTIRYFEVSLEWIDADGKPRTATKLMPVAPAGPTMVTFMAEGEIGLTRVVPIYVGIAKYIPKESGSTN